MFNFRLFLQSMSSKMCKKLDINFLKRNFVKV